MEIKNENVLEKKEMVNHPNHYQFMPGVEVLDIMEVGCADLTGAAAVSNSNVIKYILRWNKKNGLEDLKKARYYLNHLIEIVENDLKQ